MEVEYKNLAGWTEDELPKYATKGSAALDLRANLGNADTALVIAPGQVVKVGTGISIHIADSHVAAHILPRSGTGNRGLVLANLTGLIDSDYQGELIVAAWNRSLDPITIQHGERIAQIEFVPVIQVSLREVQEYDASERGENGFGSTGVT